MKKDMKGLKRIRKIGSLASALFFLPLITLAIEFENPINKQSLKDVVVAILDFVVEVGTIIAVLFLVYAGFLFVFARGSESMLDKAKQTFFWTIVGGVVILGAFVLSDIIKETARGLGANV